MKRERGGFPLLVIAVILLASSTHPQTKRTRPPQQRTRACPSGTAYGGCAACGTALSIKAQQDNVLKNRDGAPKSDTLKTLSVADMRNSANDKSFFPDMAVEVKGYVASVVAGGRESANCVRPYLRDITINIVASPREASDKRKHVVVEITPRWQTNLKLDDTSFEQMLQKVQRQLTGKWALFQGWMFYDAVHIAESESTNPGGESNWRATPWEIHPVTSYKLAETPRPRTGELSGRSSPDVAKARDSSARSSVARPRNARAEKNHSTTNLVGENCLSECADQFLDARRDCGSTNHGAIARRRCLRNAKQSKRDCRHGCEP